LRAAYKFQAKRTGKEPPKSEVKERGNTLKAKSICAKDYGLEMKNESVKGEQRVKIACGTNDVALSRLDYV